MVTPVITIDEMMIIIAISVLLSAVFYGLVDERKFL